MIQWVIVTWRRIVSEAGLRLRNALDQAKASSERRRRLAEAYKAMWANPEGRMVLSDILNECGLLEEAEDPCEADTRSVRAGKRIIGVFIFGRMRWSDLQLAELARAQDNERLESLVDVA